MRKILLLNRLTFTPTLTDVRGKLFMKCAMLLVNQTPKLKEEQTSGKMAGVNTGTKSQPLTANSTKAELFLNMRGKKTSKESSTVNTAQMSFPARSLLLCRNSLEQPRFPASSIKWSFQMQPS